MAPRKVHDLRDYGLPSRRIRLIIIGACPGEKLPPWPLLTHGATPTLGQQLWVTEIRALGGLRPGTDLHDVRNARAVNAAPRDGNAPLGAALLASGTQGRHHFSGRRAYTEREMARLQGFPDAHRFEGNATAIRKQIGNAFAPSVAGVVLKHLRRHLERVDGARAGGDGGPPQSPPPSRVLLAGAPSGDHRGRGRHVSGMAAPGMRRRRSNVQPRLDDYNGDFEEDEALELALQESREAVDGARRPAALGNGRNVQRAFLDLDSGDDDAVQDSPVGRNVAPLLERMSIASPATPSGSRRSSTAGAPQPGDTDLASRSSSVTLDFSPSPPKKRSIEDLHDGDEDQTMNEESPGKRERLAPADELIWSDEASFIETVENNRMSPGMPGPWGSEDIDHWAF